MRMRVRKQLLVTLLAAGALWAPAHALAEGTWQIGANQDFNPFMKFQVDILTVGEVINISAGINKKDSPKPLLVNVKDPTGVDVTGSPFKIQVGTKGWLGTPDLLPPATITNPLQVVSTLKGVYTITFTNQNATYLDPLDITVTPSVSTAVQPGVTINGKGRLHSRRWTMEAKDFKKNTWVKKIRVEGHTDSQGNDQHNKDLSQRRSDSVMKFLTENGVEAGRLEALGFGEARPIADNRTAKGRAQNRRVEFIIIDPAQTSTGETEAPASGTTSP